MLPGNLTAFHAVVQAGSIRKAGAAMGMAPSSISRQIAILERQIGTALFDRSSGGVMLTHAGALVADYAHAVILDFDALRTDLDDLRGSRRRLIHIVTVESIVSGGPLEAVARFRESFDGVSFRLSVLPAPQVIEAVKRGECDIGIAFCAAPHPEIVRVATDSEPIVLITLPDHPLAGRSRVKLHELQGLPLALPDENFGVRQIFDGACHAKGLEIPPTFSSNVFEALRDFVRCGAGVAVLPRRAALRDEEQGRLVSVILDEPALRDTTIDIVVRRRRLPRVVSQFVESLAGAIRSAP